MVFYLRSDILDRSIGISIRLNLMFQDLYFFHVSDLRPFRALKRARHLLKGFCESILVRYQMFKLILSETEGIFVHLEFGQIFC